MDIASLAGIILGIVLFVFGVINGGGNLMQDFVDGPSVIITIGGSLASTLGCFKLAEFINGLKSITLTFKSPKADVGEVIRHIIDLSNIARKEGLLALEEAARVDGASTWRTYWKIIFPIMKPMHATAAVITALSVWNDVMTPLVIMSGSGINTLPLAQMTFQTQFGTNYNLAFASYLLALLPILVFYIVCQKQILNGVVNGAVK